VSNIELGNSNQSLKKPTEQAPKSTPNIGLQLYLLQTTDMDLYSYNPALQWVCRYFADYLDAIQFKIFVKSTLAPCTQLLMQVDKLNTVQTPGI